MTKFLNFLYWVGMSVIGVTLLTMLAIAIGGFWIHIVPVVWRAIVGG